ncbi:pentapeptide repeat-containing protein, partial [Rosenbergiella metrosideri]|uniref:pentapeptide repeat-containing protein n=1 Tax=Rosenbergiella metrosideri TaxID=2921185 RepID=UPI001F4F3185
MDAVQLNKILEAHKVWVASGFGSGSKANLRGADLSSANLRNADLHGADLSSANLSDANLRGAN